MGIDNASKNDYCNSFFDNQPTHNMTEAIVDSFLDPRWVDLMKIPEPAVSVAPSAAKAAAPSAAKAAAPSTVKTAAPSTVKTTASSTEFSVAGTTDPLFWLVFIGAHGIDAYYANEFNHGRTAIEEKQRIVAYIGGKSARELCAETGKSISVLSKARIQELAAQIQNQRQLGVPALTLLSAYYGTPIWIVFRERRIVYESASSALSASTDAAPEPPIVLYVRRPARRFDAGNPRRQSVDLPLAVETDLAKRAAAPTALAEFVRVHTIEPWISGVEPTDADRPAVLDPVGKYTKLQLEQMYRRVCVDHICSVASTTEQTPEPMPKTKQTLYDAILAGLFAEPDDA